MTSMPITSFGVTLPELLTTVCISGVLTAVAVPGFKEIIIDNQKTSISNQLVTALNYTRSEAVKRGQQVTLKHKGTAPSEWDNGWEVFADLNGDGLMNSPDELLRTFDALPVGYTLRTGGNYVNWVAYLANGSSRGLRLGNDTFRLCDSSNDKKQSRSIIINRVGRARVQKGTKVCP